MVRVFAASPLLAGALVVPGPLFTNNMVLQESPTRPVVFAGTADPGEIVTLDDSSVFHTKSGYTTTADASGRWAIELEPYILRGLDTNTFTLTLTGSGGGPASVAENAAYGEVILCSGQSNMALQLSSTIYDIEEILAQAERPEIRLFNVPDTAAASEESLFPNSPEWQPARANSTQVKSFSAVCYLSALKLQQSRSSSDVAGVKAYGLIKAAIGSTDVQSWMSADARESALESCWKPHAAQLPPSFSKNKSPPNGTAASELWNGMIAPLAPYTLGAMLWDQGENNAHYCSREQYNCLFSSLITNWRQVFGYAELPVVFAQIGGYPKNKNDPSPSQSNSNVEIRFAQSDTVATANLFSNFTNVNVPYTAMAPTYDLGSAQDGDARWSIHCKNKIEVGRRLGLQLAHLMEPSRQLSEEWTGPMVQSIQKFTDAENRPYAEIVMSHASDLRLLPAEGCVLCCDQTALRDPADAYVFELANRKGTWLRAKGEVVEVGSLTSTLRVTPYNNVTDNGWLSSVRFAALDVPQCSLYNSNGLPAVPFEFPVPWPAKADESMFVV